MQNETTKESQNIINNYSTSKELKSQYTNHPTSQAGETTQLQIKESFTK